MIPTGSPFDLADEAPYRRWRDLKLDAMPVAVTELVVEVADIAALTAVEHAALLQRIRRCNMAVYQEKPKAGRDDRAALRALGRAFGLERLDCNALADKDGLTPLAVHRDGVRARYIPYTERPIAWHTDGYYNPSDRAVRAVLLHCVSPAAEGGANRLMDHETLYIQLRDENPEHIAALMRGDAMTIPGNDEEGLHRPATVGPVFFVDARGNLCMRYTARTRTIEWSGDGEIRRAAAAIARLLEESGSHWFEHRLAAGQGLICNNVLHTRQRFTDARGSPRLLYRARYHDRIQGSDHWT